jgi:DNA polymerase-3 subunit epsilon
MIVALDFETANGLRGSICAVGLAWLEGDEVVRTFESLVKPHRSCDWFDPMNIAIHGIRPEMVADAPEWGELWEEIAAAIDGAPVVAHNAAFDLSVLRRGLDLYELAYPELEYLCSCKLAREIWPELPNHRLDTVCGHIGYHFNHHRAGDDAAAAASALAAMRRATGSADYRELATRANVNFGRLFPGGYTPCGKRAAKKR